MITLEQVLLLQDKVDGAVEKIAQLEEENEALNAKCEELTGSLAEKEAEFQKSLSEKDGRISSLEAELAEKEAEFQKSLSEKDGRISSLEAELASLEADQSKIEAGIVHALDKLNEIENSVLKAGEARAEESAPEKDDAESEPEKKSSKASGLVQQAEEVNKSDEGGQFDIF